ncbi:MAG: condensation domain-containing protein, partial [Acidobacteriota bacterium]
VGLARGYLNRPELTAEKFIPNPFSTQSGERLYRSGDLARYLPDGNIEFLGRADYQIKIRGFRIELGEIESALCQHPDVHKSVVVLQKDHLGNQRLVSYLVCYQEKPPTVSEIRTFLKEKLPDYMIPGIFVVLPEIPLTSNGKVDRRTLPIPDGSRPTLNRAYVAASNINEKLLVEIWSQVLGIEKIGIYDNFFELGGDSILSLQITARANQAGLHITTKQIFQYQTIAELAAVSGSRQTTLVGQERVSGELPLTPIQHWFFEQKILDQHHWNQAILLKALQPIDIALLAQAIDEIVNHHDALRLRFYYEEGEWKQYNNDNEEGVVFSRFDFSGIEQEQQHKELAYAVVQLQKSLDLTQGPIIRVAMFELGEREPARLLIIVHHLAVDGVSWRILLEDLQQAYEQLRARQVVKLAAKTSSYQQWALALREYAQSIEMAAELDYWLQLTEHSIEQLPLDKQIIELSEINIQANACEVKVTLSEADTLALLQEVGEVYQTQINDLLLTALAWAIQRWSGNRIVLVDMEGHGREELVTGIDVSRTVGWFTSIYPVVLKISGQLNEDLKRIKEQLRNIPKRGVGYGILKYLSADVEIQQRLKALPAAEISFNYLGQVDQILRPESLFGLATESNGPLCSEQGKRRYLIDVICIVAGGRLHVRWIYNENFHRRENIEKLANGFIGVLEEIIVHCRSANTSNYTPSDFPLVKLKKSKFDKLAVFLDKFNKS